MGEIIGLVVGAVVTILSAVFGFCKWVISKSNGMADENRTIMTNHLAHHEERLEPKMNDIKDSQIRTEEAIEWIKKRLDV